jgi:CDP-4-dehydro-6-deoxyglucose reductase, E1
MTTYPLAATTWDQAEHDAIQRVIASGNFTMGANVRAFEAAFAEQFGAKHAIMVNSGSSANLLAVAALFFKNKPLVRPGMVAVVPAVSWATTYYPLTQYGLTLRFVDIDRNTLNFDLKKLEAAIDEKVGVVFAVNLLGNPNDYSEIKRIIGNRPIELIEDNCESMGATFEGKQAGTFGVIGTYSSFFSHHISTMEGGVCVTDDEELAHILLSLRAHGWTRNLPWPNKLVEKDSRGDFYELFRFILPGYNVRPLEMSGAIGIEQLKKLPGFVKRRKENAEVFLELFTNLPNIRLQQETGKSSWFGFAVTIDPKSGIPRDHVVAALAKAGVETRPIVAGNFFLNPVIDRLPHEKPVNGLPNADEIHHHGFYIGNHHWDVREEFPRIRDALRSALQV